MSRDTNGCVFCGVVKNKVYERNSHTMSELKDHISDALTKIDGDRNLYRNVYQSA